MLYEAQKEADNIECNRCGLCCTLPSGKSCRNLRRKGSKETYCAIWRRADRIGTPIGEGQYCANVLFVPKTYEGCPYNAVKEKYGLTKSA